MARRACAAAVSTQFATDRGTRGQGRPAPQQYGKEKEAQEKHVHLYRFIVSDELQMEHPSTLSSCSTSFHPPAPHIFSTNACLIWPLRDGAARRSSLIASESDGRLDVALSGELGYPDDESPTPSAVVDSMACTTPAPSMQLMQSSYPFTAVATCTGVCGLPAAVGLVGSSRPGSVTGGTGSGFGYCPNGSASVEEDEVVGERWCDGGYAKSCSGRSSAARNGLLTCTCSRGVGCGVSERDGPAVETAVLLLPLLEPWTLVPDGRFSPHVVHT